MFCPERIASWSVNPVSLDAAEDDGHGAPGAGRAVQERLLAVWFQARKWSLRAANSWNGHGLSPPLGASWSHFVLQNEPDQQRAGQRRDLLSANVLNDIRNRAW